MTSRKNGWDVLEELLLFAMVCATIILLAKL